MISKFLSLYLEILLEHWRVQVFVYLALLLSILVSLLASSSEIGFGYAALVSICSVLALKLLSSVVSTIKACIIIIECRKGSSYFLSVYKEWTGRNF